MKTIVWLSVIMGFFFGLVAFIIIAIIDSVAFALRMGLFAGVLSGGALAVYMAIHMASTSKKYLRYKAENISEQIIYETALFRLNGDKKDAGQLYLTKTMLIAVMIKKKTVLVEIKIPLNTIETVMQKHDYGHLANALIIQEDGTETRFISDYITFANNLRPIIGDSVLTPIPAYSDFLKDQERFKKLKREDFLNVEDEKLFSAAIAWIYGKTQVVEPSRHLEILTTLPLPCQYVIAVNAVDGEVNNGGFNQYYFNRSHILTVTAAEALSAIGALRLAEIAKKADWTYSKIKNTLYSCGESTKEEFIASYENNPLNDFDTEYYEVSQIEQTDKLLVAYIKQHIDCFGD